MKRAKDRNYPTYFALPLLGRRRFLVTALFERIINLLLAVSAGDGWSAKHGAALLRILLS